MCSNYLNMLSQKTDEGNAANESSNLVESANMFSTVSTEQAVQSLFEVLSGDSYYSWLCSGPKLTWVPSEIASPEFATSPDFATPMNDFLTSPFDDSPLDDMLTTPGMGTFDMFTSPLLEDNGETFDVEGLFGGLSFPETVAPKATEPTVTPPLNMDNLFTMSPMTPMTPSLNPSSLYSPHHPSTPMSPPTSIPNRRKISATGTRKNVTPETLVPLDAPTQPRKYMTPSATSRKDLPAIFAKKRARSQAFGDDDEEEEAPLPPNATEREQIEWKRRQNTLAARKSRKRKLQHQLELEASVENLSSELEVWKARALTYQGMLKNHGLSVPDFS